MDSIKQWWVEERAKKVIEKLQAHDFKALYVRTKGEAVQEILKYVNPKQTVGVGGTVTVRDLGLVERLESQGNIVYDHWKPGLSKEKVSELRKLQLTCEVFLSSVNAVTLNGELVNIDGAGNRVGAMTFGPGKMILVAGYNKIVDDVQEAIHRIKNIAAPLNAKRLNLDLPCAKLGRCVDCSVPNRICRATVILERRPLVSDILVILVGEELGY